MTREEIIQMAEDCGIVHQYYEIPISRKGIVTVESQTGRLLKFAKLVAELEREACIKILNDYRINRASTDIGLILLQNVKQIRARGEK
jgi:hypothetical protein